MKTITIGLFFCLISLAACSKKNGEAGDVKLPVAKISGVILPRTTQTSPFRFVVSLSGASKESVSIRYKTAPGTAKANQDFIPDSGILTIPAGQLEGPINVAVKGDSLRRDDQQFYVNLSDPVNCTLNVSQATGTIINDGSYLSTDSSGYESAKSYPGYHLVWSDEFNESKLDDRLWNYETGGNGWGNNELENYTARPQNVFVSSGNLVIEARKEDYGGSHYTSARITTQGKKEFTYGRIDIRAKLPVAKGMWPALWMLGSNISTTPWPACGETDIMEVIGKNPSQVVGSFHWKKADGSEGTFNHTHNLATGDFSQEFHVFSLIWGHDSLQILVDDMPYVKASRKDLTDGVYPFDNPFFFIFNVAVGGDWPGPPDGTTPFPQRMFVDYVRVFQKD